MHESVKFDAAQKFTVGWTREGAFWLSCIERKLNY